MEEETDDRPIEKPEFRIDSESAADWVLGKIAAIRAESERIKAQAAKRIEELTADEARLMGRFGADLENWARAEAFNRRRKSVTLLHGTLAFRTVAPRLELADRQAAADVAMTLGFVKPPAEPAPDLTAYKKHAETVFQETGELLPGIDRTEERQSFAIRFESEKPARDGDLDMAA